MIDAVWRQEGKVKLFYIDVDKFPEVAMVLNVQHVPIVFLVKDGEVIESWSGVQEESQVNEIMIKALSD